MARTPIKQQKQGKNRSSADDLLATAERLIGEDGVHAVSLRQIVTSAGQTNNFAIQYHFGDKDGLIGAIFEKHLPFVENRRRRFLENVCNTGVSIPLLLEAIFRPITEEVDENGRRTYAGFVAKIIGDRRSVHHWSRASALVPSLLETSELLASLCPHLGTDQFIERMRLLNIMVFQAVYLAEADKLGEAVFQQRFRDALAMASNALLAPTESRM